jgi:hypothetical protein
VRSRSAFSLLVLALCAASNPSLAQTEASCGCGNQKATATGHEACSRTDHPQLCTIIFGQTRGNDRGAVMRRHVGVGAVHRRFVEAGLGDPGLEVVADDLPRYPAERGQRVDMRADPVGERLAGGGFGVDEA